MIDKDLLLKRIAEIRKNGYAIESDEITLGIAAISVPVNNYSCPIALTISGIKSGIEKNADNLLNNLMNTSKIISDKILMAYNKV